MNTNEIIDSCNLSQKDGNTDKVYNIQLVKVDLGYVVNFQNGRRLGTLRNNTKTENPVTFEEAKKLFDKIVKQKKSDGYSDGANGILFQTTDFQERFTGVVPQLLNKTDNPQKYIEDDNYIMEEKFDGQRRLIEIKSSVATSINKKGMATSSPQSVIDNLLSLGVDLTVDGELVGEDYYIFDILHYKGQDTKSLSVLKRLELLNSIGLKIVPIYYTKEAKQKAFDDMSPKDKKIEGVVFKKIDSEYVAGRPASGGNQLKYKFYATDTFEVVSHNKTKRSVNIVSYAPDGSEYDMGSITIPANHNIPPIGSFVEVKYLYCVVGGKLFQTIYLGQRVDQDRTDCHMREIKFKSTSDEEE